MTGGEDSERLVAACENCGSVYAALKRPSGDVRPIGSLDGCATCDGTEFVPLPQFADDVKDADDD